MPGTQLKDPVLQACEERIEEQLDPAFHDAYMKIVVAGMHIALDKGENGILGAMKNSKDPIDGCAKGAIGLVLLMKKQSKGIMPQKAMIPASMTLMLKALDFANNSKLAEVDEPALTRATQIFTDTWMNVYHISAAQLKNATGKIHQLTQDPAAVEKMKLKAGFTKHPNAAEPTPLPDNPGVINATS